MLMPCAEPLLATGDTPEDILRTHAENAGRWKMCRDDKERLNAAVRSRQ
jgi:hypothetical protein